jgi:NADH oxidase (H2O2-forming)
MDVEILTSTKVLSIKGDKKVESVIVQGREIEADFVLLVAGIRPNVDLAKRVGIAVGETGGIVTNSILNVNKKDGTTLKNIFALGDCVETKNKITKSPQISALASTAVLQARAVAENICGGNVSLDGYLNPTITVIGGLQIGSVGLNSHTAEQSGLSPTIIAASGPTRSVYIPGKKLIHIKLLAHKDQLIGAQVISEEDVKERMNALTLAIQNRMTINELFYTERCYTPSLSSLTDPFIKALGSYREGKV